MLPTDLTVAAVVEVDGRFLMVKERSSGSIVITQPGGHIEAGESPEQAVTREVIEETACEVAVDNLLGVYLWIHPQSRQQFLRLVYACTLLRELPGQQLDAGIQAVRWLSQADILRRRNEWRTPVVSRCLEDYLAGTRQSDSVIAGAMPIQQRVADVLAMASLV